MPGAGQKRLSFPDAVANEKTWAPLLQPDVVSSVLRRRLFRGDELSAQDGIDAGGTNGIIGAIKRLMEEWGFEFKEGTNEHGKKTFKLMNPEHEPTVHVKRTPGPSRSRQPRQAPTNPLHDSIRERLVSGEEISCAETLRMGASEAFLRKEVKRLEAEGYKFGIRGHGPERTYIMLKAKARRGRPPKDETKSTAIERSPIGQVPMVNGQMNPPTSAVDMLFSDLATPPPKLGGAVRIIGAALNEEDDSVSMVMKNGSGMWKARIEGYVGADADQE